LFYSSNKVHVVPNNNSILHEFELLTTCLMIYMYVNIINFVKCVALSTLITYCGNYICNLTLDRYLYKHEGNVQNVNILPKHKTSR